MHRVVIVCTEPLELADWLSPETLDRVELLSTDDTVELPLPDQDQPLAVDHVDPPLRHVVRVPMDGPEGALRYAAEALAGRLAPQGTPVVVLADGVGSVPATARQVQVLRAAGLDVGIDVEGCAWASQDGTWLTGSSGTRCVPGDWHRRSRGSELAAVVAMLLDDGDDTPVRRWVDGVVADSTSPDLQAWIAPLQALYVSALVQATSPASLLHHRIPAPPEPRLHQDHLGRLP